MDAMDRMPEPGITVEPALRGAAAWEAELPRAAGMPAWMRRMGAIAIICALLAVVMGFVSLAEFVQARPMALGFAVIAGLFGMAAAVTRQVHAALAGRVDLLSQALEASQNAHLVLARDGGIAYANAAFRRFFPELASPPLDALGK